MNKIFVVLSLITITLSSCATSSRITKATAYKGMYEQKPVSVLLMPPINKSNNVDSKEYFHSTLYTPIANAGYYVIPPFMSMEILKKESAYDAELFLNGSLAKFGEVFGADLAVFTIIHEWKKYKLGGNVYVKVEYIIKSTRTNEVLYTRIGNVTYNTSISSSGGGLIGALVSLAATAINTAATKYVSVARACNQYTFGDLPAGKYSPANKIDGTQMSGKKEFSVKLNSNSTY
jgi:hypothetical protein